MLVGHGPYHNSCVLEMWHEENFFAGAKRYLRREAMGSSLSTVLSDFKMEKLLDTQKYIDDNITIEEINAINLFS
jgi:hypothetical protein